MLAARNIQYELAERAAGTTCGGIGAMHLLARYFDFYRYRRMHQALGYRTPGEVYRPPASSHDTRNDEID